MAREKKPVHKVQMTEGKRNIIHQLLEEYDIQSAEDIQDALKDLLGGTIKEMMEAVKIECDFSGEIIMNKNLVEKVIWWAYIILLFAIVVVKFKGAFVELRDRITSYSSQEAVVFNVIPFRNIGVQISHITQWWTLKNLLGNLLPFIPFGFLLPIAYPRIKAFFKVFLVGMFAVLFIEIFQYMTQLGSFDIDDIILNMIGVLSGYGTFGLVNHVLLKER